MTQAVAPLEILSESRGFALGVRPTDWVDARALSANTAEAAPVPAGAVAVIFSSTDNFYARYNATASGTAAAVPTDTTDGTACELNPTIRYLHGVAEISLISEANAKITLRFCS